MKKGFVIGLASGLTIAGMSLVMANTQIQAILNDQIKVTLNGQVQEFKDETTNETQYPITYHDRTYLPLRTVANLVGVDVDYDASSNTAMLEENRWDSLFYQIMSDLSENSNTLYEFAVESSYTDIQSGITSIVLKGSYDLGEYYALNFKNGKLISNTEFMKARNITESDIQDRIDKYIEEASLFLENNNVSKEDRDILIEFMKNENDVSRVPRFINKNNKVSLIVDFARAVNSGGETYIIDL